MYTISKKKKKKAEGVWRKNERQEQTFGDFDLISSSLHDYIHVVGSLHANMHINVAQGFLKTV